MKKAVAHLLPFMEAEKKAGGPGQQAQGKILLATVKGDVHDIGKNIVGVVLGCNNFEIIDLGVMVPCEKILETARQQKVDMIGLSGLITPSLDEMAHVAREMKREGFSIPLLIGGATTSKAHTSVKIALHYDRPVVHVLDASRAVGVVGQLINPALQPEFARLNLAEQDKLRRQHAGQAVPLLPIAEARRRAVKIKWKPEDIATPEFTGLRVLESVPLEELVPCVDWSPFFHAWELRGRYPAILDHPKYGAAARALFHDGRQLLERIVREKLLTARGVYGFFPANSVGDDVEIPGGASSAATATFHFLRQQIEKPDGEADFCLADFIAPREAGPDYLGLFAVTAGLGVDELARQFKAAHDDYSAILTEALADRLAEAFAEYLHRRVRAEWGYGKTENLTVEQLIAEKYRGIRPAAGYPACPDHSEKVTLWSMLDVEKNTGIKLTESGAMWPGSSVSGLYFAHPQAHYFGVGKLGRDQVLDYSRRKGLPLPAVEKWLAPYLNYEPAAD
jgi:5-methyltetrahydrofolate--homocysteine methyltransferase